MCLSFIPWSIAGVPSSQALPIFLITAPPPVLVPSVLGALAAWIQTPYTYIYIYIYVCKHKRVHIHTFFYIYIYTYIYASVYVYIYIYVYVYAYVCVYV